MAVRISRRHLLLGSMMLPALASPGGIVMAQTPESVGNFRFIYQNPVYRGQFIDFLANVFHLYPQDDLHALIAKETATAASDRDVYLAVQRQLPDIKPLLADVTYALPTLRKQKQVMMEQTRALLPADRRFEGYVEVGSNGRYLDLLEDVIDLQGPRYFVSDLSQGYSPVDIVDRGQLRLAGEHMLLAGYQPALGSNIGRESIDLMTIYIGFHHCPVGLRDAFIGALRDTLRPGGYLVVRDHDVTDEPMWRMVALAHDVFNLGTYENWQYNEDELRQFYSIEALDARMLRNGFRPVGQKLYQAGDPTHNALMAFQKV
jgi:SAM-dependent methyltransferase